MGEPGKNTKLVKDNIPKERFKTLKNIGRGLTGRGERIDQDIYVLNGMRTFFKEFEFKPCFKFGDENTKVKIEDFIDNSRALEYCNTVEELFSKANKEFQSLFEKAKQEHHTLRIRESSISLWWNEVLEKSREKNKEISNKFKGINTYDYVELESKLKSLEFGETKPLDFVKINSAGKSKKFFSSLNSTSTKLATAIQDFNSAIDVCNGKILESLEKAKHLTNEILGNFKRAVEEQKATLSTELEKFKKECSTIEQIKSKRIYREEDIKFKEISENIKSLEEEINKIGLNTDGKMGLVGASCYLNILPKQFDELRTLIRKNGSEENNSKISSNAHSSELLVKMVDSLTRQFPEYSNGDLTEMNKNKEILEKISKDGSSSSVRLSDEFSEKLRKNITRFCSYCILCNKLPDYISAFNNKYLDSIIQFKDSTVSVKGISCVSDRWIPNFYEEVSIKLESDGGWLTRNIANHNIRYRFYENLEESFDEILDNIRKTLKPFEKLTKSNCDEAIKAIDKFLYDNNVTNLFESREILPGDMESYFDDSDKNWDLVRKQWNNFMEESSNRIKNTLVAAKSKIETLKSEGKLPGPSQPPSENSVVKPDVQKPDSKKSGQKQGFFSRFRGSKK